MTQWIETTYTKQDGSPFTRSIKIPSMETEIFFTDEAYAEVSDSVADLLANNIESIQKVSEPASPGTYYGDAGTQQTIKVVAPDETFEDVTVTSSLSFGEASGDSLDVEEAVIAGLPASRGVDQDSVADITEHKGDQVSVGAQTFETIFSMTDPVFVLSGWVFGFAPTDLRVTWDDDSTDIIVTRAIGKNGNGDATGPMVIPSIKNVKELQFKNDAEAYVTILTAAKPAPSKGRTRPHRECTRVNARCVFSPD